jgi:hypothetical protein
MANASRDDRALTAAAPRPIEARRWLLIAAAVFAPIALGAIATLLLFVTRAQPVVPNALVVASDVKAFDGSILILQPKTTEQVRVPLGITIEVVLPPGPGQDIISENVQILEPVSNPPCGRPSLCAFPGAQRYTFEAVHGGVAYLEIIYGFNVCQANGDCTLKPYVYKPIAVYSRPQSG